MLIFSLVKRYGRERPLPAETFSAPVALLALPFSLHHSCAIEDADFFPPPQDASDRQKTIIKEASRFFFIFFIFELQVFDKIICEGLLCGRNIQCKTAVA